MIVGFIFVAPNQCLKGKKKLKLTRKLKELGYKSRKSFMLFGRLNNRVEMGGEGDSGFPWL